MNKMIRMATIVAGVGAMLSFAGCGSNTPEGVAKDTCECIRKADMAGAKKLATGEFAKGVAMLAAMMEGMDAKKLAEAKKEFAEKKFEIRPAKIDGDKATVPVVIIKDGGGHGEDMELVKVDGKWKVEEFNFKRY